MDRDGFSAATCTTPGLMGDDCDDTDISVYPEAPEACDGQDNDCDESIDEAVLMLSCARDADSDGYPDLMDRMSGCVCPAGYILPRVDGEVDCADREADAHPDQLMYFADGYCPTGMICAAIALSWDYDCDGMETDLPVHNALPSGCEPLFDRPLCIGSGWLTPRPGCGETGTWKVCERSSASAPCTSRTEMRRQECR
jgi:hypothetical protein